MVLDGPVAPAALRTIVDQSLSWPVVSVLQPFLNQSLDSEEIAQRYVSFWRWPHKAMEAFLRRATSAAMVKPGRASRPIAMALESCRTIGQH